VTNPPGRARCGDPDPHVGGHLAALGKPNCQVEVRGL